MYQSQKNRKYGLCWAVEQLAADCAACNRLVIKDTKPVVGIQLKHRLKNARTPSDAPAAAELVKATSAINQRGSSDTTRSEALGQTGPISRRRFHFWRIAGRRGFHCRRFALLRRVVDHRECPANLSNNQMNRQRISAAPQMWLVLLCSHCQDPSPAIWTARMKFRNLNTQP